jgi:hypothetical protein
MRAQIGCPKRVCRELSLPFWTFLLCPFESVSYFEIRISDLHLAASPPKRSSKLRRPSICLSPVFLPFIAVCRVGSKFIAVLPKKRKMWRISSTKPRPAGKAKCAPASHPLLLPYQAAWIKLAEKSRRSAGPGPPPGRCSFRPQRRCCGWSSTQPRSSEKCGWTRLGC